MNFKPYVLALSGLALLFVTEMALAELVLPSGADRRPDLSLDPFERAREALRKLPKTEPSPQQESSEPQRESQPPLEAVPQSIPELVPEPEPIPKERHNERDSLEVIPAGDRGESFSYEFAATVDALSVTSGGDPNPDPDALEQNSTGVFGVVDLIAELDTGAAGFWDNGLFFLYTAFTFGAAPAVGDLHGTSSIYAGANSLHVMEAWYEHSFEYSHSSVLLGWHDFNSEFYVSEYANLFVNGGFGMGQVVTMLANPTTYPTTTLGIRYKSALTENSYFQFGLYDGAASAQVLDKIIEVGLNKDDGVFTVAETGYSTGEPGGAGYLKIGGGVWYLRKDYEGFETPDNITASEDPDRAGEPKPVLFDEPKPHVYGAYFLAEAAIGDNLGLFFKHGRAPEKYNQYGQFYSAGLNYTGIIPGRKQDVLGVGMLHTRQTAAYLQAWNHQFYVAETVYEVTYSTQMTGWLMLQPVVQYIQQPNMDPNLLSTTVIGLRVQAVF